MLNMVKKMGSTNILKSDEPQKHYTIQIKENEIDNDFELELENVCSDHYVPYSYIFKSKYKKAKYKIVNDNENIEKIMTLLNEWDIAKPKLIVSVTGGAGQFSLPSRIKTAFKYGIAKIAESTDALIITGYYSFTLINC